MIKKNDYSDKNDTANVKQIKP